MEDSGIREPQRIERGRSGGAVVTASPSGWVRAQLSGRPLRAGLSPASAVNRLPDRECSSAGPRAEAALSARIT